MVGTFMAMAPFNIVNACCALSSVAGVEQSSLIFSAFRGLIRITNINYLPRTANSRVAYTDRHAYLAFDI